MKKIRLLLLITIFLFAGLRGVRMAFTTERDLVELLIQLAMSVAFPLLCQVDAAVIGKRVVRIYLVLTFFMWIVLIPAYLIWSRGAYGMWLTFFFTLGFLAAIYVPLFITRYALFGAT